MTGRLITAERIVGAAVSGDALRLDGGRVVAAGRADQLRGGSIEEKSYPGGFIVPGLRDAHFHPLGYAAAVTGLNLAGAVDLEEVLARTGQAGAALPPDRTLVGSRLDDNSLAERRLPDRSDLDRVAPDRPVLLYRVCGHVAVANTAALEAAGVAPDHPDPPGGTFDRDEDGRLTGILRETAVAVVAAVVGDRSGNLQPDQVLTALAGLPALGLTSLGAMVAVGPGLFCGVGHELELLLEVADHLPLKLAVLVIAERPEELEWAAGRLDRAGGRVRFLGMKDFADGSLGGWTAALRQPYRDASDRWGTVRLDPDRSGALARRSLELGGKVAIHAIGDRAAGLVLDLFERLRREGAEGADLRIEHASLLADADVDRLAGTGAFASIQPAFLASEEDWVPRRLGSDRLGQLYRFATMAAAGIPLAGGSDCPVEPPDPRLGMAAARAGVSPAEALTAEQALALFTAGAAAALGEPEPLAPGSAADFVVLDADPTAVSARRLTSIGIQATWIDGIESDLSIRPAPWGG